MAVDDEQVVFHQCPKVGPGFSLPPPGMRWGRLVPCQQCGETIFRADAWEDVDDDLHARLAKAGREMPTIVDRCDDGCEGE